MKKQNDGGFVYPQGIDEGASEAGFPIVEHRGGLSVRAYFAAAAMQGLISNPNIEDLSCEEVASDSVMYADALIKKLGE